MILPIEAFKGVHCETTTNGTLLKQLGIELSEPMLFGLGEGLGFIFWKMKSMEMPFIGGRCKPDALTIQLAQNIRLRLSVWESSSIKKSEEALLDCLNKEKAVGVKLDCYYLEYFRNAPHFAAHYVAMYGYDEHEVFLIDTQAQGTHVKTSWESFRKARAAKGPMSSKNLFYTLDKNCDPLDIVKAAKQALQRNAISFLHPPIQNIGFRGIASMEKSFLQWTRNSENAYDTFGTLAMMMEKAGTGGGLFRKLYRDFLMECDSYMHHSKLTKAIQLFDQSAHAWTNFAIHLEKIGISRSEKQLQDTLGILPEIAAIEKEAMELVLSISDL